MKLQSMKCPNCDAPFSINVDKSTSFFCPYCGTQITLNDNTNCFEINYSQTNRNIDEAQIRRVDAEKEVELKKLELELKKSKQRYSITVLVAVTAVVLICLLLFPKRTSNLMRETEMPSQTVAQSPIMTSSTEVNSSQETTQNTVPDETYPTPVNTELSYGYLDPALFSESWEYATYRCGSDFPAGEYYIMSITDAAAMYDVSDDPTDFQWSMYQVLRKVTVKDGQYVKIPHGGMMVHANEVDTSNWEKYGVFLVGKDLPEGEYKIETLNDYCALINTKGTRGAYQICEGSPENIPISCNMLFENQAYITLKNGEYLVINNVKLTACN